MAMTTFNEQQFENKLVNLKDSQESINTLSSWCLQNKDHHKKIVNCWLHCLKRVKIEQRLSLFYLANDVIQYSKRKHYQFVESWGTALQKATTLVRDDKVKSRIMRIFKIWDERGVYDEAFISDLCGLLTTNVKKKIETNSDSNEFQPSILVAKIKECKNLEEDTDLRFKKVKENCLHLTDVDSMRTSLKDRRHGSDVVAEVDAGVKKIEAYVKALELEIAEREKLIDVLHQAMLFYESQRGEAKIVCNAYRNFGNKVKLLKRKLDDLIPTLSDSPIPSPDANAPSPSSDSDFELPSNEKSKQETDNKNSVPENNGFDFSFINSTFMGNSQFSDINLQRDVFNDSSHTVQAQNQSYNNNHINLHNENVVRPIEVINTREQKEEGGFNITDFIKSLLPTGVPKSENDLDASRPPLQNMEPLQPPPMPPIFSTNDTFSVNWKTDWGQTENTQIGVGTWNHETNSQEWNVSSVQEPWSEQLHNVLNADTPESPPLYEKKGVSQPVEYDDSMPTPSLLDVDHRTLLSLPEVRDMDHRIEVSHRIDVDHRKLNKLGPKDVDHRNLISLTGSPKKETKPLPPPPAFVWPGDQDYRCKLSDTDFRVSRRSSEFSDVVNSNFNVTHQPIRSSESNERKDVNVESIDMDVSEEDEEEPSGIIQLEEDVDDRVPAESLNSFYHNQSNMGNISMPSSFVNSIDSNPRMTQDVDERLKTIFGGVMQTAGAKLIPPNDESSGIDETQIPHPQNDFLKNKNNSENSVQEETVESNGFDEGFCDRNDYFRREPIWQADGQSEQALMPCPTNLNPRGGNFGPRMGRNVQRPLRGRMQHRFPFRPHHPRMETPRGGRMPFRSRLPPPVRGGRW